MRQRRSVGQVVQLGNGLLAWVTMLALDGTARRWEPKALRHRIYLILDGCTDSPPLHHPDRKPASPYDQTDVAMRTSDQAATHQGLQSQYVRAT